jgi:hypothetical protein
MEEEGAKKFCNNCGRGYLELNHYYCEMDKGKHNGLETCMSWCIKMDEASRIERESNWNRSRVFDGSNDYLQSNDASFKFHWR